jgi:chromosome segregation ATPase
MEKYKQKILEVEEQSQQLLEALKGLQTNASALSEAKADLNSTAKTITAYLDTTQKAVEGIQALTEATKELTVPELLDKISDIQGIQQRLQKDIKTQLSDIQKNFSKFKEVQDELKAQSTKMENFESELQKQKEGLENLTQEVGTINENTKAISKSTVTIKLMSGATALFIIANIVINLIQ